MEIHKIALYFSSMDEKFRWESFIDVCKMNAKHDRPATDHMFDLIKNYEDAEEANVH